MHLRILYNILCASTRRQSMKKFKITVVFKTHMLACSTSRSAGVDVFQRDYGNNIVLQQASWYAALGKAIEVSGSRLRPGDIKMNLSLQAETSTYTRRYGISNTRDHEAVYPNTKVEFEGMANDDVKKEDILEIFKFLGDYVGLSPFGHGLGYGKFTVIDVNLD